MGKSLKATVEARQSGLRLDVFLSEVWPELSRAQAKRLVVSGAVAVGGSPRKASYALKAGDVVSAIIPDPEPSRLQPESIPLDIVYEDRYLLVVNKPAGLTVHPAAGARRGTLVHALLHHCNDLSGIGGVLRPGIVHRLDKGTSGLLVVAKNDSVHRHLSEQIRERSLKRVYRAVVWGWPGADEGTVDAPVGRHPTARKKMAVRESGGKRAVTRFKLIRRYEFHSLLELELETGRTHQIRAHMAHLGCPVFGDPEYGGRRKALNACHGRFAREGSALLKGITRQALHAWRLSLVHPVHSRRMEFTAPLPGDMEWVLERLEEGLGKTKGGAP
jgi:23S rRNA pseudouridine1911/1915/1917 synthase